MAAIALNQSRAHERLLLKALMWSLAIHLLCAGVWKWGQTHGWWETAWRPAWMQTLAQKMLTPIKVKVSPPKTRPASAVPLIFVDTDPSLAVAQPPKDAKFYSANNTLAANPDIQRPSDLPNIIGHQDKELKATDANKSKAQPLQPSPKHDLSSEPRAENQPRSRQSLTPGDLAMAKPREIQQTNQGSADVGVGDSSAPTQPQPQPAPDRPRTLEAARQRRGLIGQKSRQNGGVAHLEPDSSFAAMSTSYGDYDREFIDAVKTRWYLLLENHTAPSPGRVVVEFQLLSSGRITDLKVVENTVDELSAIVCSSAISANAPYRPWPRQMQLDLGSDHRDVRFTFYYDNE